MAIILWVAAGALFYTYAGYVLLLWLIVQLRGTREVRKREVRPRVSLVISAYDEASIIRQKLENALALQYRGGRLEIVVVSDESTDGTDDIVLGYASRGVRLERRPVRGGKTAGLNHVVPALDCDIVVFSDANAMYAPDAIEKLVRNFADPEVGCVTGEARYLERDDSPADAGERAYWDYEIRIKRLETAVGSMVGGDGAIYAIRKELWQTLPADAINDFLNPLQIVAAGWRGVYEPQAICYEETAGGVSREYRRRVRIVSRSWRAIFQAPGVLNPFKVGLFALSVVSHKVLRWFSGAFLVVGTLAGLGLVASTTQMSAAGVLIVTAVAGVVYLLLPPVRRTVQLGVYFVAITGASVIGLVKGSLGRVSGIWSTPRAATGAAAGGAGARSLFAPRQAILAMAAAVLVAGVVLLKTDGWSALLTAMFFLSAAALVYVYLLYPVALGLVRRRARRDVLRAPTEPTVCLFITANDEAGVIGAKMANSLALEYPPAKLTILVASDGSVDGTNEIVRSYAAVGVRLLAFPERRGKIAAINEGMEGVASEIVVFSDANTLLEPGAIRALVRNFADPLVGAVSGDVILEGERAALGSSEDLYYRYERWLQACESDVGTMVGVDGALYAIRRELFVPPPTDTILDDMAIPMSVARAGRRVVFEPAARAHERGCDTATEEFMRKVRVAAGAVQFLRRSDSAVPWQNRQLIVTILSHKALRWLSPVFAFTAFASAVLLSWQSNWFLLASLGQAVFLVAGVLGCSSRLRRVSVIGIAHYFWLVQVAATVGFARGLLGRQPVAWRRFQRATVEPV